MSAGFSRRRVSPVDVAPMRGQAFARVARTTPKAQADAAGAPPSRPSCGAPAPIAGHALDQLTPLTAEQHRESPEVMPDVGISDGLQESRSLPMPMNGTPADSIIGLPAPEALRGAPSTATPWRVRERDECRRRYRQWQGSNRARVLSFNSAAARQQHRDDSSEP